MAERVLPPARYERRDVTFRQLTLGFAITLFVLMACTLLVIVIYPSILVDRRLATPLPAYPEPRLQSDPAADLQRFEASELARLNSSGDGHISIGEAMQRIASQGIPDWPTKDSAAP